MHTNQSKTSQAKNPNNKKAPSFFPPFCMHTQLLNLRVLVCFQLFKKKSIAHRTASEQLWFTYVTTFFLFK